MKLTLDNFIYKNRPVGYISQSLGNQLRDHLVGLNITCNGSFYDECITFSPVKDNKLFISIVKNKIQLNFNDVRVAKIGRSYLFSERLTEEQYDGMIKVLNTFFDKTGIECDIKFYEFKNDDKSFVLWRQGKVKYTIYKPNSFPVAV